MSAVDQSQAGLDVVDLTVYYGGSLAVDRLSLSAPMGRITGLIGPNGAGKTTTFNACDGLVRPTQGTFSLFGRDVTADSTGARARAGLGRTFQRVQMCGALPVHTNVSLGLEARTIGTNPIRQVFANRSQAASIAQATEAAMEVCGISHLAARPAATLSSGQTRLVELARVLAGGFRILLLDEPSSGLDEDETQRFAEILREVVAERGIGILLVEHDMGLVMDVCDYLYVLDFGCLIFEGSPAEVRRSESVRAAYLGSDTEEPA